MAQIEGWRKHSDKPPMWQGKGRFIEVAKKPGHYYQVHMIEGKWARPFSPKEFTNKREAQDWAIDFMRRHPNG